MKRITNLVLIAGMFCSLLAGVGVPLRNAGQASAQAESPRAPQALDFKILELSADNYAVVDHDALTGDDRGGIATSNSQVFYTGDEFTARFDLDDLSGGTSTGAHYDTLVSDLLTGQVYLLGENGVEIETDGDEVTVAQLLLVDGATGALTGEALDLNQSFTLNTGYAQGMFAGYGRVVVYDGFEGRIWSIGTASGVVTDLAYSGLTPYGCENWAFWGIAEHFGGEDYLVYRNDGTQEIVRTRLSDGDTSVLGTFTDLSDMCSISANPERDRWYFHYEGVGQFGGENETLGYASATFEAVNGTLQGHVFAAGGTTPVEGAEVAIGGVVAVTDAGGAYTTPAPAGVQDASASHPMYETAIVTGVEIITDTVTTQDFYLTPRGRLFGYITDYDSGEPLEARLVADDGTLATSDPLTGFYEMYLDEGTQDVRAEAVDELHISEIASVTLVSGEDTQQDYILQLRAGMVPTAVSITLDWQTSGSLQVELFNRQTMPYEFTFAENDQGFIPQVELLGAPSQMLNQEGPIALVSDDSTLEAVAPVLDSLGLTYDVVNDNDPNLYMADPAFLVQYDLIIWYQSGYDDGGRAITQAEHDAVEAWLQAGGKLIITGYDMLGSPDDPLMADLVRSSTFGDGPYVGEFEIVLDHPVTNGPFGTYPPGTPLVADQTDHDTATPDTDRGTVAIAMLTSDAYAKIMATELDSGGVVLYWNGNAYADDWLVGGGDAKTREDKGIALAAPAGTDYVEGETMFKNALAWLSAPQDAPWLGEDPLSGSVPSAGTLDVTLLFTGTFAAGVDQPGDYFADLILDGDPRLVVPVVMTVLAPEDMGKVEGVVLDNCSSDPVKADIAISGGDPITQTVSDPATGEYAAWLVEGSYDLTFSADGYISTTLPVEIAAGEVQVLDVALVPTHPCIAVQPQELEAWLVAGTEVLAHPSGLTLTNDGGSPLSFEFFEKSQSDALLKVGSVQLLGKVTSVLEQKVTGFSSNSFASSASGGPDPFGYIYTDSTEPGGPIYDWVEIAPPAGGGGTALNMTGVDDGYFWPLDLPFTFPFYGVQYNQMAVASNGTLYFQDDYLGYSNTSLPTDAETVRNFIAHFWDDLYISPGEIYYLDLGDRIILEFYQVAGCCEDSDYGTWQVILFDSGSILFQYQDVDFADTDYDNGASATVGIQAYDTDPTYFLEYSYNSPVINPELAICFEYPGSSGCGYEDVPWVWQDPVSGTVSAQSDFNVGIYFTAVVTDPLPLGTYNAILGIKNNDRGMGTQMIPTTMYVVQEFVDPQVSFEADSTVCMGDAVEFTNTSVDGVPPVDHFVWDFGDGESLTVEDFNPVSHTYAVAGTYQVTLTGVQKQSGSEFTFSQTVVVNETLADFTYTVSGMSVLFSNTSTNAETYLWDFGDGETSTETSPEHTYAAPGEYEVTLTATGGCGVAIKTETVTVDQFMVYQPLIFKMYDLP